MKKTKIILCLLLLFTILFSKFVYAEGAIKKLPSGLCGVVNEKGKSIIPCNYKKIILKEDKYYIVQDKDLKYGVFTADGKLLIPCKYDLIYEYAIDYGFFKCKYNATMALYDTIGKCIIQEGIYTDYSLYDVSEEQIIYTKCHDKVGLCDINGNEILPPNFDKIFVSHEVLSTQDNAEYTYFKVVLNSLYGAYSMEGNLIIPPNYSQIFYNKKKSLNYFTVKEGDTEGVIDTNGNIIIPSDIYSDIIFSEWTGMPYFKVKLGDKEGCYDIHGNMLMAPDYDVCYIIKSFESSKGYVIHTEIKDGNKTPLIQEFELYANNSQQDANNSQQDTNNSQQEELRDQYIEKADIFFEANRFAKAAKNYSKAIRIRATDYLYFNRAVSYYNNNKYNKAIRDFNYVLSITSNTNLANRSSELIEKSRIQKIALAERRAAIGAAIFGTLLGVTAAVLTSQNNNDVSSYSGHSNVTNDSDDNDDYTTDTNTKEKSDNLCLKCYGSGKCPQCNGTGCRTDNMFGTGTDCEHDCGICGGSGDCPKCGGKGRL